MFLRFALASVAASLAALIGVTLIRRRRQGLDVGTVSGDWISKQRGKNDVVW